MKLLFKFPFIIALIISVVIIQTSLTGEYTFASNIRDDETIFKKIFELRD